MTPIQQKKSLRTTIRKLERELPATYKKRADDAIAQKLLALPEYQEADTLFCFVSTSQEINTTPILLAALQAQKRLCVPLCKEGNGMALKQIYTLDELSPGTYGIFEPPLDAPDISPDDVDLAVIPCLTCNHEGKRLGQGGGYYDRFLSGYRSGTVMICREKLIREEIPVEPHDYPIPWVLTEVGLFEDGTPTRLL